MREVTLLNSADDLPREGQRLGRCVLAGDEVPFTRMIYLMLALSGRYGVQQLTLDPDSRDNSLQCRHSTGDYLSEDDMLPPPAHIRHYLVYHALSLACRTTFTSRLYWVIAQVVPRGIKARIHVRYKETTYHWHAVFRRRAVMFSRFHPNSN